MTRPAARARSSTRAGSASAGRVASPSTCCRVCTSSSRPATWVVWGPDAVDPHLWPGRDPGRRTGTTPRRSTASASSPGRGRSHARVAFYAHHLRPGWKLAPVEVTTVHDTIPFRYPPSRALAPLMRAYIAWMARHSTLVVTDSEFSKQSLQEDLGLDPDRIVVLQLAIDHDSADRVRRAAHRDRARRAGAVRRTRRARTRTSIGSCSGFGASDFAAQRRGAHAGRRRRSRPSPGLRALGGAAPRPPRAAGGRLPAASSNSCWPRPRCSCSRRSKKASGCRSPRRWRPAFRSRSAPRRRSSRSRGARRSRRSIRSTSTRSPPRSISVALVAGRGARPGLAAPGRLRPLGSGRDGTRRVDRSLTDVAPNGGR